ncbi:Putative FAD dependent oxidoreductase superfamily [Penicillium brasilianum]|uniref:Putative FAD dependent oxidoreductase superfamily n=1 Tax=Penicillium brasilianum TaxID=104259 RepID=A0A0F7TNQ8_PENBI|nr:Putative FAD dependent oxidoreductase superfamily [Penicillium brasilianum]
MSGTETIVVIGAGVIGLSTALSIQEHLSSTQSVLLVARDFPSDTSINYASPWAGAHYRPVPGSSPQALREASQAQRTFNYLKKIATEEPAAGIKFIQGIEHLEAPPPDYLDSQSVSNVYHFEDFRPLKAEEVPAGVKWGVEYGTYVINSPVYCAHMLRKFVVKGGRTQEYTLVNIDEAFALADNVKTVVNCSGTGFGDPKSFIIRGQTCLVRNPVSKTITRQNKDGTWSFCIPRPLDGGTVIGGTKQPHDWDPNPSPEIRTQLLSNASKWFPFTSESGGKFDVIRDIVGRRPAREGGMRIEVEQIGDGKNIVHAYGAGGRGFELSRGVAEDATALMLESGLLRVQAKATL